MVSLKKHILSFIILLFLPFTIRAEGDAGKYGAFFTYWGTSARALGMVGALTGLADDASAGYFNPAGLTQLNTHEITFMHSIVFKGGQATADVLTYGGPISPTSGFGATLFHFATSKIPYRPPGTPSEGPYPESNRTYNNREMGGLLTFSTRLLGPTWIGGNGKIFYHQLHIWSGMGFGLDVGLFFFPDGPFSLGINVQNAIKPRLTLIDEENIFPTVLRAGFSIRPWREKFTVSVDMIWSEYRKQKFGVGLEYRPFPLLHFRGGVNESFAGVGLGLWRDQHAYEIRLDYAFQIPYQAGNVFGYGHNVSLSLMFGGYRAKSYCPVIAFSPTLGEEGKNIAWIHFNIRPRTEVEKWEVVIKDESGTIAKKVGSSGEPPYRVSWDGKDENSILVPDGNYYYLLKVVETGGKVWTYEGFLASMYWVPPSATTALKVKEEAPIHILEEEKEREKKAPEKRRGK